MSLSQEETVFSTFQVPVWNVGMQLETKGSQELLKSKYPQSFEAFSTDDKLSIGNGHGGTGEKKQRLDVECWRCNHFQMNTKTFCSNLNDKEIGISQIRRGHLILEMSRCCKT